MHDLSHPRGCNLTVLFELRQLIYGRKSHQGRRLVDPMEAVQDWYMRAMLFARLPYLLRLKFLIADAAIDQNTGCAFGRFHAV